MLARLRRWGVRPGRFVLTVSVATQTMRLLERAGPPRNGAWCPPYHLRRRFAISTSAAGVGQIMHSNCTPLGLHRIAQKIGAGQPIGAIFRERKLAGFTWQGQSDADIVHRIFWLEGLEPGFNRGGNLDSFRRFIYIHGFGDEMTLGRPKSLGCLHVAASDLIPLFDLVPVGTVVWIDEY
jgi:hypothetical protein